MRCLWKSKTGSGCLRRTARAAEEARTFTPLASAATAAAFAHPLYAARLSARGLSGRAGEPLRGERQRVELLLQPRTATTRRRAR